ncbi:tigger transposable element-derived protein 1-like [Macrobrachium rosenbergii]|uniref:tigger transposable element-derived protein 1-like n=1 Tax=Macrobrachium rosenbergii TaxID=79674 RepID=UPI0034D75645
MAGTLMDEVSEESFKATWGWFDNFKNSTGVHSVIRHGEAAASSDVKAAEEFVKSFAELVEADGYVVQQVINCDETGLFWKNMPRRTYIMAEEKSLPGYVEGKLKGVSHQEKFVLYVNVVVGPTIKNYLTTNNLALKALRILNNPPAHSPTLTDDIYENFKFIWVLFFPLSTTPILQPMDQQVILNFKKLFTKHLFKHCSEVMEATNLTLQEFQKDHYNIVTCHKIIDMTWQCVTRRTLKSA